MKRNFLLTIITLAFLSALIVASYYLSDKRIGPQEDRGGVTPTPRPTPDGESLQNGVLAKIAPELLSLFNESDDWRRTTGNIIASTDRDAFFIFKGRPSFSDDGRTIMLDACTVVFMPNADNVDFQSEEERASAAIVFESTDRVDLVFSKSLLDFLRTEKFDVNLSSFVSGEMHGPVIIRSELNPATNDDDFFLQTRNVVFTTKQIRSNYEVSFSFGKNHGAGRGLTVDLEIPTDLKRADKKDQREIADQDDEQNAQQSPDDKEELTIADQVDQMVDEGNLGGGFSLRKVEIDEVTDYARFYLDSNPMEKRNVASQTKKQDEEGTTRYLDVRCKKDVTFAPNANELGGWCASFTKDVDLIYFQDDEKQVNLKCDRLYLYLQDSEIDQFTAGNPEAQREVKRKKLNGKIRNLTPTVVRAIRSEDARASIDVFGPKIKILAGEFQYNMKTGLVDLTAYNSSQPVRILKYGESEETNEPVVDFSAGNIQAALNDDFEILRVVANSNGTLVLRLKEESGQTRLVQAVWQDGLQAKPELVRTDIINLVASGSINFNIPDLGSFDADEVNFWCRFSEDSGDASDDDADALLRNASYSRAAQNDAYAAQATQRRRSETEGFPIKPYKNVEPIAARMSGNVSFKSPTMRANIQNAVTVRFATEPATSAENDASPASDIGRGAIANSAFGAQSSDKCYQLSGGVLRIWCVLVDAANGDPRKPSIELYRMQLVDSAEFKETNATTEAVVTRLSADFAQIDNPNGDAARIEIRGEKRDAQFQTNNLTLSGRNVVVDRAANTFTVAGNGSIAFQPPNAQRPTDASESFKKYFTNDPILIAWDESMTFNGSQLIFKSQAPQKVAVTQLQKRPQGEIVQSLSCAEARVTLKRQLMIFDINAKDKSQLEVKTIECLGDQKGGVEARLAGVDEKEIVELYQGTFTNVAIDLETQTARAAKGGEIYSAVKSQRAPNILPDALQQNNDISNVNQKEWIRTHAEFAGELDADLAKRTIVARERVRIVVAEYDDANTRLNVNDAKFPPGASQISADKATLQMVEQGTDSNGAKLPASYEVIAQENVTLRRDEYSALCESLRYSTAKELIVLTASDSSRGMLIRQKGSAATREDLANFKRCDIKLNPFSYSLEGLSSSINRN
ncbi:MAG: hypothetical protein IJU03_03720 [Thermoguttaceae bacterium]|nr:hypothetical protein [Thermoguttaceae bacterium]